MSETQEEYMARQAKQFQASRLARGLFRTFNPGMVLACECSSMRAVELHHVDYDRPWLVGILCKRCHSLEHVGKLGRAFALHDLRKPIEPRLCI